MMEEVWKEYFVQDYGNIYVSNYGNVKNKKGKLLLKRQKQKSDYLNPYYYIRVNYTKDGKRKIWQQYIHRLVAICFIDNPENKLEVNHIDGNKLNNNVSNLEWVTRKENMIHAKNKNLLSDKSCENNGRSKLTKEQVIKIRKMYKDGYTKYRIAKIFNIGWTTVQHIINFDTWKF